MVLVIDQQQLLTGQGVGQTDPAGIAGAAVVGDTAHRAVARQLGIGQVEQIGEMLGRQASNAEAHLGSPLLHAGPTMPSWRIPVVPLLAVSLARYNGRLPCGWANLGMSDKPGDLKPLLAQVAVGRTLSESEAEAAFDIIMSGDATPSQMGAFLMALRVRGETVDEIAGAARIMRSKALMIDSPPGTIDTVGTGGDGSGSFNVSTATGLVVAGCGVPVAKHGNR